MTLVTVEIREEKDIVVVRQRARLVAARLGFDKHEQTRIATAVSEVARNAFVYSGSGRALFALEGTEETSLVIRISDHGPGISDLDAVLSGRYKSSTGLEWAFWARKSSSTRSRSTPEKGMEPPFSSGSGSRAVARRWVRSSSPPSGASSRR